MIICFEQTCLSKQCRPRSDCSWQGLHWSEQTVQTEIRLLLAGNTLFDIPCAVCSYRIHCGMIMTSLFELQSYNSKQFWLSVTIVVIFSRIGSHIMGYKKRQAIKKHRPYSVIQDPYYRKWKRLKKHIKDMVFVS